MAKVLWHVTMSLDGFIAGPRDSMDWMLGFGEENDEVDELIKRIGAVLSGRRTYDVGAVQERPEFRRPYGGAFSGPVFVLTLLEVGLQFVVAREKGRNNLGPILRVGVAERSARNQV